MSLLDNVQTIKNATSHIGEIMVLTAREDIMTIDKALASGKRSVLTKNNFIPASKEASEAKRDEALSMFQSSFDEVKARTSGALRDFFDTPVIRSIWTQMTEKFTETRRFQDLKLSIMDDVQNGKGPLKPETVIVLTEIRGNFIEAVKNMESTPFPELGTDEDEMFMATALTFPFVVMVKNLSEKNRVDRNIQTVFSPAPSEDELVAYVTTLNAHEDIFQMVVDSLSDAPEQDEFRI